MVYYVLYFSCVISRQRPYIFYAAEVGVTALLWLMGLITLCLVSRVLVAPLAVDKTSQSGDSKVTSSQVKMAIVLLSLTGATWLIALLTSRLHSRILEWIFCICNILVGFLVMVFRCVLHAEAQAAWQELCSHGTFHRSRGSPSSSLNASRDSDHMDVFATNTIIT